MVVIPVHHERGEGIQVAIRRQVQIAVKAARFEHPEGLAQDATGGTDRDLMQQDHVVDQVKGRVADLERLGVHLRVVDHAAMVDRAAMRVAEQWGREVDAMRFGRRVGLEHGVHLVAGATAEFEESPDRPAVERLQER